MAKKRNDSLYEKCRSAIYNKDIATSNFIQNALDKTISMFVYSGLPDTIPPKELEKLLQCYGKCIVADVDGNLYALKGGFSGVTDVYENPTQFTVANVALNLSKTYTINEDCILFKNDFNMCGLTPVFEKYAVLIGDTDISMNMASVLLRIPMLISAPDDKTKDSAEIFLKRIQDGEFGVIGETPFFDGIKTHTNTNNYSAYLTGFIELIQYYKASFCNEIGLNANFNMKRERLNESEIGLNIDALLPLIDEMYSQRVEAISSINEMFGTDIIVDYNSVWKTTHEEEEKETDTQDTIVINGVSEDSTNSGNEVEDTEAPVEDVKETEETTEAPVEETEETSEDSDTEDSEDSEAPDTEVIEDIIEDIIESAGDKDEKD